VTRDMTSSMGAYRDERRLWVELLNLIVRLAPTGWKHYHNSILFRGQTAVSPVVVPASYEWKLAGPKEIQYMDTHPEATSPTAYARRAQMGDRCVCLKQGGELVGYQWIRFKRCCALCGFTDAMELPFLPLAANQAFFYDLYTYKAHRKRGVGTLIRKLADQGLSEMGIDEVLSLVSPQNLPALRLRTLMQEKPDRMVYGYRIRNWHQTFLGPLGDTQLLAWWDQFSAATNR
jgi:GNAT superfamily N-acetyltransferase